MQAETIVFHFKQFLNALSSLKSGHRSGELDWIQQRWFQKFMNAEGARPFLRVCHAYLFWSLATWTHHGLRYGGRSRRSFEEVWMTRQRNYRSIFKKYQKFVKRYMSQRQKYVWWGRKERSLEFQKISKFMKRYEPLRQGTFRWIELNSKKLISKVYETLNGRRRSMFR